MFTGIVEEIGTIGRIEGFDGYRTLTINVELILGDLSVGASISIDGACHTVVELFDDGFAVNSIGTTLAKTIASQYQEGSKVNLERATIVGSRLDGHLVQGHVDGTGEVTSVKSMGQYHLMDIDLPDKIMATTVVTGSITVNGVSLTVNAIIQKDLSQHLCQLAIIPFTWRNTNLGELTVGSNVNVEGDVIGKYLNRFQERSL